VASWPNFDADDERTAEKKTSLGRLGVHDAARALSRRERERERERDFFRGHIGTIQGYREDVVYTY